jgi:selenocysteine lyase/cysteine desulfurase/glyoxylase-like metal-dependent hydrolase (beta-lactamase superfamily II)/rhodanese-related sulfurtransferase
MSRAWTYKDFVADALTRIGRASCEQVNTLISENKKIALLDIREADETVKGFLPGAILLPRGLVEKHIHEHIADKNQPVYIYCSTGNRSALVGDVMTKMGFSEVFNVDGGIERWQHLGLPVAGEAASCVVPGAKLSWEDVRREFAIVQRRVPVLGVGERALVYLDHAASTHAPESVLAAYMQFLQHEYANVHRGTHLLSRKATERFEEAYYIIADYLGAELRQGCITFTQNTTHAIDLASHVMADRPGKVITTEMEHHSNELTHRRRGSVLRARVDENGELDLNHLADLLRKNEVKLVAVTAGSNVTGLMPNIHAVARIAHDAGALILVDAAQALARTPIKVKDPDDPEHIDFLAGAGHKAYAPFGAGFLYGPRALMSEAEPYLPGGGTSSQVTARSAAFLDAPDRHQGGTPNIAGVVGMARALQFLQQIGLDEVRRHEIKLTKKAVDAMQELGGVTIYGNPDPERRLGVLSFNVNGVPDLLTAAVLSEEGGLAVRNGRFCAHIYVERLLRNAQAASGHGGETEMPDGAVRASFGLYTDEGDVDRLVEFIRRVRDRKWRGHYRVKGDKISAEFAGRCADRWMESVGEPETSQSDPELETESYIFEALQPDGTCRSYLIADAQTREAALVDPLREKVDEYLDLLQAKKLTLRYTIETHTHADHLSGSRRLKELTGAQMLMHVASPAPCVDRGLRDGDSFSIGSIPVEVIATPGHTHDGMCLVIPGRVLTGDTLLIGGCGRTDLPSGSSHELYESLRKLKNLPEDTLVCPAHDYNNHRASTIGREKKNNKRMAIESTEEFHLAMAKLKLPPPLKLNELLAANQQCTK